MFNKLRPSRSIAGRLTLRVTATLLMIFSIVTAVIFIFVWGMGLAMDLYLYELVLEKSNEKVNGIATSVETAIANNVPEVEEFIEYPDKMYDITKRILRLNPDIVGSAVAFRPDFYPEKGRQFSPYAYRLDSVTIKTKQLGSDSYDYHNMEWYVMPVKEDKGYWGNPYLDEGGGEVPMITYSLPLKDAKGETYGVITADLSLDWITDIVNEQDSLNEELGDNFYSFIVARDGTFIAHHDKNLILKETIQEYFKKTETTKDDLIAKEMLAGKTDFDVYRNDGTIYFIYYAPIEHTGWSMAIVVPFADLVETGNVLGCIVIMIMAIGLIIVFIVCYLNIRNIIKPLTRFAHSADQIALGNFNTELPQVNSKDEMLHLRKSFEIMQESLVKQIEETKQVNEQKGRIESELMIARHIQMSMLPKTFPPFPERSDISIYASLSPAKEVGGDLYDFLIRDEKLFFCIGDVSGKGIPASLLMAVTRALFRMVSTHESNPGSILSDINEVMARDNDSVMFVTLFVGVLDMPTGRLRYSNGGHNAPILISSTGTRNGELPVEPNYPIGIVPDHKFSTQEALIDPYTTIFLYTDGLTEAEDIQHAQFGEQRIFDTVNEALADNNFSAEALVTAMKDKVKSFVDDAEQSDDLTMLSIQYLKMQLDVRFQRSITLPNNIEKVPELAAFVDEVCEGLNFDVSLTMSINLAIEEAVVNVMNYAYPLGQTGYINIEAQANDERLKITISDNGKSFDPTAKKEVDTSLSAEERPIGGLGIHLVRHIMDSINYERVNGKNVLTLRKKLPKET